MALRLLPTPLRGEGKITQNGFINQTNLELINVMRKCYTCGEIKPIIHFTKKSKETHGYGYQCKKCNNAESRKYVTEHAEERNLQRRTKYHTDTEWCEKEKLRNKKNTDKRLNKPYNERTYEKIYNNVKSRCKNPRKSSQRKHWVFDISLEYALEVAKQQNDKCALTGIPFTFKRTGERYHDALLPSIDRINTDMGYITGNIQWTNIWANTAKLDYTTEFFHEMCLHTVKNNGNLPEHIKYPVPQVYIEAYLEPLKPIEINPKLKHFKNIFTFDLSKNPLRKCRKCGREAWTNKHLKLFRKNNRLLYGRDNICKECVNKRTTEIYHQHNPIKPPLLYLRKCIICGLEAKIPEDLELFRKEHSNLYGHLNICKQCDNKRTLERRRKKYPKPPKPSYLKKCKLCGLEAKTEQELENFVKSKNSPYERRPLCKQCAKKQYKEKHPYMKPKPTYLRKCRVCGLEAHDKETLTLFINHHSLPYGHDNLCITCRHKRDREYIKKHKNPSIK